MAWITLNRPEALNAVTPQFGEELLSAIEQVADDARCVHWCLTGAGRGFSRAPT